MRVAEQRVAEANVAIQTVQDQVHPTEAQCRLDALLAVERQIVAAVGEACRLDEHAARAASWIENFTSRRRQHLDQQAHDRGRGEELSAAGALGACEAL